MLITDLGATKQTLSILFHQWLFLAVLGPVVLGMSGHNYLFSLMLDGSQDKRNPYSRAMNA